jgi:uncharacterized protein (DUF1499 family)
MLGAALALQGGPRPAGPVDTMAGRRAAIATLVGAVPFAASAFDNGVADMIKYKDRPKQRGPAPRDIGLKTRIINVDGDEAQAAVKICSNAPNCFTTTGDVSVPGDTAHIIAPWKPPKDMSAEAAIADVVDVIKAYVPGQSGIDGGGFRLVTVTPGYVYAQFESLRQGYVDDVEFAVAADGAASVQVRSSSRLGYLDFTVNAKRLNAISDVLRKRGWNAPEITRKSHPEYFGYNLKPSER